MENLFFEAGIAVTLFTGTNIDDLFVLLTFFSDKRFKVKEVIFGQLLGILALTIGSIVLALGAQRIPLAYIGLLGLVPLGLGLSKLRNQFLTTNEKGNESEDVITEGALHRSAKFVTIVGVTIANGGDNLGVYVPLFSTKPFTTNLIYLLVFLLMTGLWCAIALYMVNHKHIGGVIKRYGHNIVPWVFIVLGFYIIYEAGSFRFFINF